MSIRKAIVAFIALLCIAWFAAAAYVGMSKNSEWYGPQDTPTVDMGMAECIGDEDDQPVLPCYYDATQQGNGEGHSYTMDATGHVTYWDGE